ncbi:hypothetical protein D3C85_1867320 [compost metagenome]
MTPGRAAGGTAEPELVLSAAKAKSEPVDIRLASRNTAALRFMIRVFYRGMYNVGIAGDGKVLSG